MSKDNEIERIDSYTDDSISLSNQYKKFISTGFLREIISNLFSIVSVYFIARYVDLHIQDQMFFLSNGMALTGSIALLGYIYSLTRKAIVDKDLNSTILYDGTSFLFLVGLPLNIILNLIIGLIGGISFIELIFYLLATMVYYFFNVILLVQDIILQAHKNVFMQTLYIILNSITVPLFFVIFKSLTIIFVAWIVSLGTTFIFERKVIFKLLSNLSFKFHVGWEIFLYGFPVYVQTIYNLLARRVDAFILYLFFPTGALAEYNWAYRLSTTVFSQFTVLLIGTTALLTNYSIRKDYTRFNETIKSTLKIGVLFGLFLCGSAFIGGDFGILLLLSNEFSSSALYFKILLFSYFLRIIPLILTKVFNARGNRRILVQIFVTIDTLRIVYLLIFAHLGPLGIAFVETLYSVSFLLLACYMERKLILELIKTSKKFLISIFLDMIIVLLLSGHSTFILATIAVFTYILIYSLLLFLLKPFNMDDYALIEKIIGTKLKANLLIKKLFVTKSN